jgi:tryptophan halogenase
MENKPINNIVIVGGGTSGWMTAAALANALKHVGCDIQLVESEAIGTVGVGEATIPHIRRFNESLGIDENEFMRRTNATYKMGVEFSDWGKVGTSYMHPFAEFGHEINNIPFHHYWLKLRQAGDETSIQDYCLSVIAAKCNKFDYPPDNGKTAVANYSYAFHLDASLYAKFLREYAEKKGVIRTEGKIVQVLQHDIGEEKSGFIKEVQLENGEIIKGDLFIDCSGFRALLIEQTLNTGYEDWSHWLPCDRAVAVPCASKGDLLCYTQSIARSAGWQWRIPLQSRTGNGYVYCSKYISDDEALKTLLINLDGEPLASPNFIRFKAGRRKRSWEKNCVAIGLSSGFLEPLESTSIYLIQIAITRLLELFPDKEFDSSIVNQFNDDMKLEYERVRDFLILHYSATERDDSDFWRECRAMAIPQSLNEKINLFRQQGYVVPYEKSLFLEPSWVAVYLGQGVIPRGYDVRANHIDVVDLGIHMEGIRKNILAKAEAMPAHEQFIKKTIHGFPANVTPVPRASMNLYGRR